METPYCLGIIEVKHLPLNQFYDGSYLLRSSRMLLYTFLFAKLLTHGLLGVVLVVAYHVVVVDPWSLSTYFHTQKKIRKNTFLLKEYFVMQFK